jgi:AcrR family transcriptional regulator
MGREAKAAVFKHGASGDSRREGRRRAILDAAEALFLERGFTSVSLFQIVRRSGGSLATVYEMFGNKQGLLRAVVERSAQERLVALHEVWEIGQSAATILRAMAMSQHEFAMSPRTTALMRLVIAESLTDPEFGRKFHRDIRSHYVGKLADAFQAWSADGSARIDDPEAAAELYYAMIMCDAPIKALLGSDPERTCADRIEWRLAPFLTHFQIK